MIVGGQTEARAQLSSTIIDYHEPFDQGFFFRHVRVKNPCNDFSPLKQILRFYKVTTHSVGGKDHFESLQLI